MQIHPNITSAAAASANGDRILIQGATTPTGEPLAYSDATTGESFPTPITIPGGVVVRNFDSTPVYVVSTQSGATLFKVAPTTSGSAPLTSFVNLNLAGATNAIRLEAGAGEMMNVRVKQVNFGRNTNAVSTLASGATIDVLVDGCKIGNGLPIQNPVPHAAKFTTGIKLIAKHEGHDVGRVNATVANLSTIGLFGPGVMAPSGYYAGSRHDLEAYANEITRLVQVGVTGDENTPEYSNGLQPITKVVLDVQGGDWDGKALQSGHGWDVGLYAETSIGGFANNRDFHSAFEITMSGTEVRNFQAAGIYAETKVETRGQVSLSQVDVHDVGVHFQPPDDAAPKHNGVHMVAAESYLALVASDSEFHDNRGDGVYLFTAHSIQLEAGDVELPSGLFLGLDKCRLEGNSRRGLGMDASRDKTHWPATQGGVVGGTWDFDPSGSANRSYYVDGSEPSANQLANQGQGYVNRCAIGNNGDSGVEVFVHGGTNIGGGWTSAASVRLVNNYIWKNAGTGLDVTLLPYAASFPAIAPTLLMPVVHCTIAENGGSSLPSMEVVAVNVGAGAPSRTFRWQEPSGHEMMTSLFNSVFELSNPNSDDFGSNLESYLQFDDNMTTVSLQNIGWAGLRAWYQPIINLQDPASTSAATPFLGQVDPSIGPESQYFLDPNGPAIFISISPDYLNAGAALSEDGFDYVGSPRNPVSQADRTKGAKEEQGP